MCVCLLKAFIDLEAVVVLYVLCYPFTFLTLPRFVSCSDSTMPVTSRVCFVRFSEQESVGVSQHLTNTVFVDRALIVVPYAEGWYLLVFALMPVTCSLWQTDLQTLGSPPTVDCESSQNQI